MSTHYVIPAGHLSDISQLIICRRLQNTSVRIQMFDMLVLVELVRPFLPNSIVAHAYIDLQGWRLGWAKLGYDPIQIETTLKYSLLTTYTLISSKL